MIRQITLINFMSHEHTVLDLSGGVNVLIGPNNCGKSAVVEALRAVCENSRGNYMIRHGEKECRVILETGEGDTIEWRRRKKGSSYVINGEEVHRGRVPDKLNAMLRMQKVEVKDGSDSFDVHLGEQKAPIFLIDQPGSKVATFFASASDAHYLVQMQEQHRQNVREQKNLHGTLQERITRDEATLKKYKPLAGMEKELAILREGRDELASASKTSVQLKTQLLELVEKQARFERLQQSGQVLEKLQSPPDLYPVDDLARQAGTLDRMGRDLQLQKERFSLLEVLQKPPEMEDLSELKQKLLTLVRHTGQLKKIHLQLTELDGKLEGCREHLRRYASQQPTCPHCHRPWSEEELLELLEKGESHDA